MPHPNYNDIDLMDTFPTCEICGATLGIEPHKGECLKYDTDTNTYDVHTENDF